MISIIMPYYNKWELTHKRLSELYRYGNKETEIILVNDASPDLDCHTGVKFWQDAFKVADRAKLRYLKHEVNKGFGGSMNDGVKLAHGDIVILLSNDVITYGDFIPSVVAALAKNEKTLVAGEVVDWAAGWNEFDIDGQHFFLPYANGWFLACTRKAWDELGGFDPLYLKFDFEDVDLSTTALSLGYNLYALKSPLLLHIGGATIATVTFDRMSFTRKNRELYIAKWGNRLLDIYKGLAHA